MMGRFQKIIVLAVLAALTFIIYSNVLYGPFIFDDGMYISKNPQIGDLSSIWPPSPRFLTYLSFFLNYAAGGLDTFGYHLFNILVHILNSALVFSIALLVFNTPVMREKGLSRHAFPAAIIAAFLFATHPVQTQAVSYITQRFASFTALFYLLSLASYLKWRSSEGSGRVLFYIVALVSTIAAQFTKEIGFTLPAVIVLTEFVFFRPEKSTGKRLLALLPFILAMAVIPALMFGPDLLGFSDGGVSDTTRRLQLRDLSLRRDVYVITQFRVMITYFSLIVLPVGQNMDYDYPLFMNILEPEVLFSAILVVCVFISGVVLLLKGRKGSGHALVAGYGITVFFMAISIESSIIPILDVIYEHRLYLPNAAGASIFFSAVLMALFDFAGKRFGLKASALAWALVVTAVLAVPLSIATWSRNRIWSDEILFWRDVASKSPDKERVLNNLGAALYSKGFRQEGMVNFKRAAELQPAYADARYNLGNAYKDLGLMEQAITEYQAAVKYQPGKLNARNNLGMAYFTIGRYEEAAAQFETILMIRPDFTAAKQNLDMVHSKMNGAGD